MTDIDPTLLERAENQCELCQATSGLQTHTTASATPRQNTIVVCDVCGPQLAGRQGLDPNHWYCLQGAIWSETPAVQVVSWRILYSLQGLAWAQELLEQAYLADDVLAWAKEGASSASDDADEPEPTLDGLGNRLADGDSVTLIKDLNVKGTSFVAKRGTLVKNIRLTNNPKHVEGRVNKVVIVLVAEYLKKA